MIYENRRAIAVTAIVPIICILLLSIHFKAWSGYYVEGDLESVVVHQMETLESGYKEENTSIKTADTNRTPAEDMLFTCAQKVMLVCPFLLLPGCVLFIYQKPADTLRSLSVRMNN